MKDIMFLLKLIDVVWGTAYEDDSVPSKKMAMEMLNKAGYRDRLSTKELGKKECKHDIKLVSGGSFQDRFECQKEGCDYYHH